MTTRVAVFGASGYAGLELLRLLLQHPEFEIVAITSEQRAGQPVGDAFPALRGQLELCFQASDPDAIAPKVDLAFTALPHSASARTVAVLRRAGVKVADLSADFRLSEPALYASWYGEHAAPELLGQAVYGLPELHRDALKSAELVGCAGCYPTSALLPLVPFLREGRVEMRGIIVDSKSGISGAGRKVDAAYLFTELDGNGRAYKPGREHRHSPEMEQEATRAAGDEVRLSFVPHLIPVTRGILTSVYCRPKSSLSAAEANSVLDRAYANETFVRVLPVGETPNLAAVRGTNFCDVAAFVDEPNGTLILLSALDNLVKGASGQAIQCANLMQGLPESQGLLGTALLP
ncbi:MAG: N-acetyl-gamma-glutamyl-phosphate reductase [Myxococcales bacterium]|nr:N-acetyl-gamma-glutamyl-phosphate reductase [Myxococcales bacterium]